MAKKNRHKEKKIIKQQAKQEREAIVQGYIDRIIEIIDNGYAEMTTHLDEFNKELENGAVEYGNMQQKVMALLKTETTTSIDLNSLVEEIAEFEERNLEIYETITSRDINKNRLLKHLPVIAEQVGDIINEAHIALEGNKNQKYITSMIVNRSFSEFNSYNAYVIDVALESNSYIDIYIDARENFIDFINECKKELENQKQTNKVETQIEKIVKYNQRLRVDYTQLESFLKHKGYTCDRQGSTTHAVWRHEESGKSLPLPNKSGTIPQGTTSKVLKQMGSSRQELAEFLYA